jgi:hypothetical protein
MSRTVTTSAGQVALELVVAPAHYVRAYAGTARAFGDFCDWEAVEEDVSDAADLRLARENYEAHGLRDFTRIR